MTGRRLSLRTLLLGGVLLLVGAVVLAAQNRPASLAEADRLYGEKSYAGALKAYEALLKGDGVPAARQDEVRYRVAVCLGKTKQWDRALVEGLEFVKTHRGTVWEPRGLYWLGRLYLGVPHEGYRVGAKVFRGSDVPQNQGDQRPEAVQFGEQDRRNALDALEAARVLFPKFRADHRTARDEIQLDLDLARVLLDSPDFHEWAVKQAWAPPTDPGWKVTGNEAYGLDWAPPKKVLFLHEQIGRLAPQGHSGALALLGKATWLRGYHAMMRQQYAVRWEGERQVRIPYPYEEMEAVAVLRQLVRDFPDDPVRDQAQVTVGFYLEQDGKFVEAEAEFRRFLEERPESKWTADARAHLQELTRATLALQGQGPGTPGQAAQVHLSTRNLKQVRLEAFRVDLEAVLARPERLSDPHHAFGQFDGNFGNLAAARRFYGPRVASWMVATHDRGDHQPVGLSVPTPLKETGAYVVEASAPGLQAATVVVVTDLVIVQKLHRDGALLFAANARTGKPVSGARLVLKQTWQEGPERRAEAARAVTNAEGMANVALLRGPNRYNFQVETLARKGERYALTQPHWSGDYSDNPDRFRVYSVTDRAVYRPQQTVHYRQMVMRRQGGEWRPVTNRHVKVEVSDPRGERVFEKTETVGEFGSVSGSFELPEGAPLGEYQIDATVPNEQAQPTEHGGNRFRVEEYKKPEFEVTVTPAAERVRLGEPTRVRVHAEYTFGGPVPGAKVSYRVHRTPFAQQYRFPRPFDFLQRQWNEGDYNVDYRQGPVVAQGEARLDEKGDAKVSFPTRVEGPEGQGQDFSYTVEADVQDASRRTISGTGAVKATRHDVAVFLNFPRGYASQGDRLDVEIVTLNPSDQPVSVPGTAKVYRQPERENGKETPVHQEPLKTDAHGRAYLRWTATAGGQFRIAFETRDTAEEAVEGATMVWVQGPELDRGQFFYHDVFLAVKEPYYEEGQTAKVLLVTPAPDCAVLVTRQANNEILERRLVRVPGRSLELDVPLGRRDVPNVYLSATLVRDGQLFAADQELFVPAAAWLGGICVGRDTTDVVKARLGAGAVVTGGHPGGARSWRLSDGGALYVDGFDCPDGVLTQGAVVNVARIEAATEPWNAAHPLARVTGSRWSVAPGIARGMTRARALERLGRRPLLDPGESGEIAWTERGQLRVNADTVYRSWTVALGFYQDRVARIDVACE